MVSGPLAGAIIVKLGRLRSEPGPFHSAPMAPKAIEVTLFQDEVTNRPLKGHKKRLQRGHNLVVQWPSLSAFGVKLAFVFKPRCGCFENQQESGCQYPKTSCSKSPEVETSIGFQHREGSVVQGG